MSRNFPHHSPGRGGVLVLALLVLVLISVIVLGLLATRLSYSGGRGGIYHRLSTPQDLLAEFIVPQHD